MLLRFAQDAWSSSTLVGWVLNGGIFPPSIDKRHRRTEAQMLRQFIRTASAKESDLRRKVERLEELAVLDTTAPDALLFLLGDECFELKDMQYTCVRACVRASSMLCCGFFLSNSVVVRPGGGYCCLGRKNLVVGRLAALFSDNACVYVCMYVTRLLPTLFDVLLMLCVMTRVFRYEAVSYTHLTLPTKRIV